MTITITAQNGEIARREAEAETGRRFGRWTAVCDVSRMTSRDKALCRCDCGTEREVRVSSLRSGESTSCGCYRIERASAARKRDMPRPFENERSIWRSMKRRCSQIPGPQSWHLYGGRGIKVCEQWLASFDNFLSDVGPRPSELHSLDRINPDGDYEPGNVRWATSAVQSRNTRVSKLNQCGVDIMRYMRRRGSHLKDLAHAFGIAHSHVAAVCTRKAWSETLPYEEEQSADLIERRRAKAKAAELARKAAA